MPPDATVEGKLDPHPKAFPLNETEWNKTQMDNFAALLKVIVGGVLLVVWTVVGFLLYVPLLVRQIAAYSAVLTAASLGKGNIERAQASLEKATRFFPDGYSRIFKTISAQEPQHPENKPLPVPAVNFVLLGLELLWALFFWVSTLWLFGLL